jgi:hypothetical protein
MAGALAGPNAHALSTPLAAAPLRKLRRFIDRLPALAAPRGRDGDSGTGEAIRTPVSREQGARLGARRPEGERQVAFGETPHTGEGGSGDTIRGSVGTRRRFSQEDPMKIVGLDGLSDAQIRDDLANGARFVVYFYCVSILVLTFKQPSSIHFIRPGQSAAARGLGFTLLSLVLGWWGIPWGRSTRCSRCG